MKLFFKIFLLLSFCMTFAQQSYHEDWNSAESKEIPQNCINSIVQDKYGFIWLTTENGLVRFDGKFFKTFNSGNTNLESSRFSFISGSIQKDSLFTNTTNYADEILITERTYFKIGNLKISKKNYIGQKYEEALYFHNFHNDSTIDFKNLKIVDKNGNHYEIKDKRILFFNKKNKKIKEVNHDYEKNTIYFLYKDQLMLLNYKQKYFSSFSDNFANEFKFNLPENSKLIYNHTVQQLFVYTKTNIFLLDIIKNKIIFKDLFSKPKLNINIKSLFYDQKNEKLFIGTLDKGLNIISRKSFNTLINQKNEDNIYYASYPISDTEFVTSKGEIFNDNKLVIDLKNIKTAQKNCGLAIDKEKNIWFAIQKKIFKFTKSSNYESAKVYEFEHKIGTLFCDSQNKIWVGMAFNDDAKLYTIDANEINPKPLRINNINKPVIFFTENHNNEILMVCDKEILTYSPSTKKIKLVSCGKNEIRSLFIDKDKMIWACSYNNGFSLLKNDVFYKMPFDNEMYLLSAHCIKEDKLGYFWISTNKGLIQVKKETLLKFHQYNTPVYYEHYNIENGFLTNEFNGGCQPCAIQIKDKFIFPSLNGMVVFDPINVKKPYSGNDFFINEAELDGKYVHFKNTLIIDREINRVVFKIDFAYFGNKDNITFDVLLNSEENSKWINLKNENAISFTNIPPGNHVLCVRRINPFTSKYEIKKIKIIVPTYFYEKLYFKVLIVILFFCLVWLIGHGRVLLIRKKNADLEKLITERTADLFDTVTNLEIIKNNLKQEVVQQKKLIGTISHDIRSPLRFLSITANNQYINSLESTDEKIKINAKIMQESSGELYRFVANLVDYSKVFIEHNDDKLSNKENIDIIIQEKINLFKNLASDKNIEITYKNHATALVLMDKKILGIIIHNLLDNAIKNTMIGTIALETKLENNKIYVSVSDTGVGMSEELKEYYIKMQKNYETNKLVIQNYGLGLHMILELLRLMKGDIEIISNLGVGTKISIIIDKD